MISLQWVSFRETIVALWIVIVSHNSTGTCVVGEVKMCFVSRRFLDDLEVHCRVAATHIAEMCLD